MSLSSGDLSAADVAAVVGNGGNGGFGNWGDGSFWIIVLFLFALMGNGWGNGFGGGNSGNPAPYVQQGFDQAAVMNGLTGINSSICSGFANAETAANARQIADMQTAFAGQTAMNQGFNAMQSQLAQCCCQNQLQTAQLGSDLAREACADRAAVSDALRDVLAANTASTQRILDQMCQDKIDAKNEQIANLRQQMNMMQLSASQNAQTQALIANNELQTSALEQYLAPVPRPAYIVQNPNGCNCGQNYYNGCGCGM
jgi:hypothetical protein